MLKEIISLGCNCHPAYWLRQIGHQDSMPFDWLLSRPHLGLDFVCKTIETSFRFFATEIVENQRGHPVSSMHPMTEFFHHHDLLNKDEDLVMQEIEKLRRRVRRFSDMLDSNPSVKFLYCYPLDDRSVLGEMLSSFEGTVEHFQRLLPDSELLVYFMKDSDKSHNFPYLKERQNLVVENYVRDMSIDKVWGGMPAFLSAEI